MILSQTKTSKKEIKSALEIFQRELRGSTDSGGVGGSGGGGGAAGAAGSQQHPHQYQQGTFSPVPPPGVQNMAALYLKVTVFFFTLAVEWGGRVILWLTAAGMGVLYCY